MSNKDTTKNLSFLSKFYKNNCYFGCYPNKQQFECLIDNGFNVFLDLTTLKEKNMLNYVYEYDIIHHNNSIHYINYSIVDNRPPVTSKESYIEFLVKLETLINNKDNKIYIHCRGGHGRSSLVVSSLLSYLNGYPASQSFLLTKAMHDSRQDLKDKYKYIDCPQVISQRKFVMNIFNNDT
jgi:protein-tyrosine phosphatase